MPGVNPYQSGGPASPITYEATSPVTGGQVLVSTTVATSDPSLQGCAPCGDLATNVIGVAAKDAVPVSAQAAAQSGTTGYAGAFPTTDVSVPSATVVVYHDEYRIAVTYTTAAAYKQKLVAAVGGAVRAAAGDGSEDAKSIGWCSNPGGVTAAGVGYMNIDV